MLSGKKVLIGITGSIAAYKAILLVRLLIKSGAEVKVVVTPAAKDFVSALTLSTLSKNDVLGELADGNNWTNHVMLGRWADVMLIAPLSCNTLAKMAAGLCDNLLLATYLSATCPVVVAPAMDEDMWHHHTVQKNLSSLTNANVSVISVVKGELASGLFGEGRMAEPEDILVYLEEKFFRETTLTGKEALVTAGPTYEAIDPVRFIGNHSSGKMGIAIAEALYMAGANVRLVCGPTDQAVRYRGIEVVRVTSAEQMYQACVSVFDTVDIGVLAAAVADYTPDQVETKKIKKTEAQLELRLNKTKDILKQLGSVKRDDQLLVGFALETNNEDENARIKLREKKADLMVLNSLQDKDAGFKIDTNKIKVYDKNGGQYDYESKSKKLVAEDIVNLIIKKLNEKA